MNLLTDVGPMSEFSRLVQVDAIDADGRVIVLRTQEDECLALAQRLDLQELSQLRAEVSLRRTAAGLVRLNVDFSANVVQSCVVSLEAVRGVIADRFSVLCEGEKPRRKDAAGLGEIIVDPFGDDTVEPSEDGKLDIGELIVQHLSLSLDPYPRALGVEGDGNLADAGKPADENGEAGNDRADNDEAHNGGREFERENPFAALKQLRHGKPGGA